jgi:choline dehydrogenase-like flavoprotein
MIESSRELTPATLQGIDVCIVGAGAAGITLACELDGSGLKVVLLEAGGFRPTAESLDFYKGSAGAPHPDLTEYRRSAFGGTTRLWGGRCIPLDPIDLQRREYVAHSGWPISYEELARHYPRALAYCDAGKFDFTVAGSLSRPTPTVEGLDGDDALLTDGIERYSLPTDFGERYRRQIARSGNVTALLHARCVRLNKRPGGDAIESVELIDRAGQRCSLAARVVVLTCGGIEVPRLLLASDPEGNGLGNRQDLLGRFYSCHFATICARLESNGATVSFDFERTTDGVYCRRQLRFSAAAQSQHRLLNMVFRLHFPEYSDARHGSSVMSAIYLAKSALPAEYRRILRHGREARATAALPHVGNVIRGIPQLLKFSGDWLFRMQLAQRKIPYTLVANRDGSFPLEFNCEQTPSASNRVCLADDTDSPGLRRAQVHWRLDSDDVDSALRGFLLLRDRVSARSQCRLQLDEEQLHAELAASAPVGGHHLGTARMASSPRCGVVDPHCSVFGLPNLFIASSAVFPTSGFANPTLTIVALAVRLAGHLKRELEARSEAAMRDAQPSA